MSKRKATRKNVRVQAAKPFVTGNGNKDRTRIVQEMRRSGAAGIHKGQGEYKRVKINPRDVHMYND